MYILGYFIIPRFSYVGGLGMKQSVMVGWEIKKKWELKRSLAKLNVQRCQKRLRRMRSKRGSVWKRESTKAVNRQTHRRGRRKPGLQIPAGRCVKAKCVPRKWECETAPHLSLSCAHTEHCFPLSLPILCTLFFRLLTECHVERTPERLLCMGYDNKVSGFPLG